MHGHHLAECTMDGYSASQLPFVSLALEAVHIITIRFHFYSLTDYVSD